MLRRKPFRRTVRRRLVVAQTPHVQQGLMRGQVLKRWRMEVAAFREAAVQSRALSASLHRYTMTFLLQVSQTAACNAMHQLDERLARWLLMTHDRADGDHLPLTHEYLSIMLAVRRSGV